MVNKGKYTSELVPLYKYESIILLGLVEDFPEIPVRDGLVIEINIASGRIENSPWSFQKKLKFGFYYYVNEDERFDLLIQIQNSFHETQIREMIDMLLNPTGEAIKSLVWLPKRLRKQEN